VEIAGITARSAEASSPATVAALMDRAQRSERSGRREVSRRHYESALYMLGNGDGETASLILRRVARTYIDDGQFDAALDCLTAALAVSEALGETVGIAHAINSMAGAHLQRGNLDDAEALYARAQAVAAHTGEERLNAMIAQNLGIIASMRGDLTAALGHYAASLSTYRAAGLREYVGPVLNNMGLVYVQLGKLDEAQAAYDEALLHCNATDDKTHRLLALINSTDLWLARGDVSRAAAMCKTVLMEATAANDQQILGETYRYLGIIARTQGELEHAERYFTRAYENAVQREDFLLAAETAREQAELYELMGKNRETLQSLSLSLRLFTKLQAERNLADIQQRVGRLEASFEGTVTRWAQTIESADHYTHGHCERVAAYACALARDLDFDEITMFWFRIGALLHDVGKIVVPSEILNKPGKLTPEERTIIEQHAAAGSEALRDIDFPWDILPMVRGHHERWDGSGYPDKIAGATIDLSARITCIADVFDALTSDRPYRRGFTVNDALKMMAKDVGTMFDPALFPRFERLIRETQENASAELPAILAMAS
jgi:putative nucleotidyltransferase with HDIG domain